ncbi:hypothetical protein BDP55DRAFT_633179 [Colletotrichum godetiae]|uniref:Uncharacterized protein n=1 Tax=Colletotrichum godetiae TaxID=1209918 RepID=A0AAJ0EWM1_9PEZI|nr:uncharacterized protein BDP55DRAFT_633179 [Colletotrichum godetiae]KAK1674365.1 hypothetical protein BDP55DRAFT_633179 [Colletotrichum godetiae]
MVTVYRIRAAPCRPFLFSSSTVLAHTGTKSAAGDSAKSSENDHGVSVGLPREKHDTKAAWLWDNTSFNLELNRKEVEVVVVQILRQGSRKKSLLTARGWKHKTKQETSSFCCYSRVGSGGLSVWAYAPITSDIMPFEAGDPGASSKFRMGTLWKNLMSKEGRGQTLRSKVKYRHYGPTQGKHRLGKAARTGAMGAALVPVLQRVPRMGDEPRHILIKNNDTDRSPPFAL